MEQTDQKILDGQDQGPVQDKFAEQMETQKKVNDNLWLFFELQKAWQMFTHRLMPPEEYVAMCDQIRSNYENLKKEWDQQQ